MKPFYVLVDLIATGHKGEPVYFKKWTGIGPACTSIFSHAAAFHSRREALDSPAYSFILACFRPIAALTEDDVWDALTQPEEAAA